MIGSSRAPGAVITDPEIATFRADGFVVLRGFLGADELERLQRETQSLIDVATAGPPRRETHPKDFVYARGHTTNRRVLRRIEFVVSRSRACAALLAHPGILGTVERLVGADLIPTWDSMVVKMPGEGIAVPWHRDAPTTQVGAHPIFNVDFYLDAARGDTALRALPGTQALSDADADAEVQRRSAGSGFDDRGAAIVEMRPGDVLLHDILLLHGSPPSRGNALRRVVYYEYRSVRVELERGPHTPAYLPLKRRVLVHCIDARAPAHPGEAPYRYAGATSHGIDDGTAVQLRVPHSEYWRG